VAEDLLQVIENNPPVFSNLNINDSNKIIENEHKENLNGTEEKNQNKNDNKNNSSKYKTVRNVSIIEKLDSIVIKSLKESFQKTDDDFIKTSAHPQHGYIYICIYIYIYVYV
jgi:hypothetical protein